MSSSRNTSRRTSPVEEASGTMRFVCPKRVLSWWWSMSIDSGTRPSTSGSAMRLSFAQSTASRTRSDTSSGQRLCSSFRGMNPYSPGSGASPQRTMTESLPNWSSASFIPSSEPRASPSGFSWVVIRKRSCARIASATAARSLAVVWGEFIDELRHADPALDRGIVLECQLRSSLQMQPPCEQRLQDGVGGLQRGERLHALALRSEDGHEDTRVAKVGGRLDAGDRNEPDTRILQLPYPFG